MLQCHLLPSWRHCRYWFGGGIASVATVGCYFTDWGAARPWCSSAKCDEEPSSVLHSWTEDSATNTQKPKRAVVIGAGVAGVTSAYQLSKRGYEVVLLEARAAPGVECSAVAAGAMPKSNPVINRASWKRIIKNLFSSWEFWHEDDQKEFQYFHVDWWRTLTDPHFLRWCLRFAYEGLIEPAENINRQQHMLAFTVWSIDQFENSDQTRNLKRVLQSSSFGSHGAMIVPPPGERTTGIVGTPKHSAEDGNVLNSSDEICAIEPFIRTWRNIPSKALYQPKAHSGNSEVFTQKLAEYIENDTSHSVTFYFGTHVSGFRTSPVSNAARQRTVTFVETNRGPIETKGAHVVIAAGSWTPVLAWQLGMFIPIYPLKGYCCRIDDPKHQPKSKVRGIITDGVLYFSQLGRQLRVTSIGEFCGWDSRPTLHVDRSFRAKLNTFDLDISASPTACGLRPMSADGAVLIGLLDPWSNVSINVGPGSTGWKISLGGAELLARSLDPKSHEKEQEPFDRRILSPTGRAHYAPHWSQLCQARYTRANARVAKKTTI